MDTAKRERFGNLANEYHVASCNSSWVMRLPVVHQVNYEERIVELVKRGPLRLDAGQRVSLDVDQQVISMTLAEAIETRYSSRSFDSRPLDIAKLARLLYLANGQRRPDHDGEQRSRSRNAPNAGGLGSVELYLCAMNVAGLAPGFYHFDSVAHDLCLLKSGDFRMWVRQMAFMQEELSDAAVLVFLVSNQVRLAEKYGLRAYRLGLMDAGHVSENLYLVSTALGLAVCATAGFIDDEVNCALNLDGVDYCAVLTIAVGER